MLDFQFSKSGYIKADHSLVPVKRWQSVVEN
ncbi:protein of unknown function [Maridesulfovibrio hydrothermalis AM13 = DSM 14728]|uniref:Uncharacterized protein n=1 Tax=Maridesulfovibrio hydrothermalis AM13 = DSM 14728 TaxID=1121451 RepID=L0RAQ3_9BACT|nr:protein of unknown function [Maridesulfovibrio hydrothermalis AM13 = DSM 14728]